MSTKKESAIILLIVAVADAEGPTYLFESKPGVPVTQEMLKELFDIKEGPNAAKELQAATENLKVWKATHQKALEAKAMPQAEELRGHVESFTQFQLGAMQLNEELVLDENKTYTMEDLALLVSDTCGVEIVPLPAVEEPEATEPVATEPEPVAATPAEQAAPGNLEKAKEAVAEAAEAVQEAVEEGDVPAIVASGNEFIAYIQKVNAGNAEMRKLLEEQAELVLKMLRNSNAQSAATDEVVAQLAATMATPALPPTV
jgi:hypothetical protein